MSPGSSRDTPVLGPVALTQEVGLHCKAECGDVGAWVTHQLVSLRASEELAFQQASFLMRPHQPSAIRQICATRKQTVKPINSGRAADRVVHLALLVSR